jgi:hypothetical protein
MDRKGAIVRDSLTTAAPEPVGGADGFRVSVTSLKLVCAVAASAPAPLQA